MKKRNKIKEREWSKKYYQKHIYEIKKRRHEHSYLPHSKFLDYKRKSRRKNLMFEFTEEQFMTFWQKPCYYCGSPIQTIGLDRVDSSKGYMIDNVVPCCMVCNWMKNSLPLDIFMDQCQKIANKKNKS